MQTYSAELREQIAVSTLRKFWENHPDAEQPLKAWFDEAVQAQWLQSADIKAQYRHASVLKNRCVIFNIEGNDYRLIVAIAYQLGIVYIKFIGTHAEYGKIDAEIVEMERTMEIRPIRTDADYKAALKAISRLIERDPEIDTPDGDRLDVLTTLVQAYEAKNFPIDLPDPVEAIKFRMEQAGLTVKVLEPMIGQRNRVYQILNCKRSLTLPMMIWRLHRGLGIPAANLIQPVALRG